MALQSQDHATRQWRSIFLMDDPSHLSILTLGRPLMMAVVVASVCATLIGLLESWNFYLIMSLIPRALLTIGVFWVLHAVATCQFGSAWISWGCAILATAAVVGGTVLAVVLNDDILDSPPPFPRATTVDLGWLTLAYQLGTAAVPAIIARYWLTEY